ncbi:MAG: hypothetical protein MGG11_13270 [Trichodesmium sp. MAG_R03]|nr:hypothetical protein [Trichodesmium sp. MAG_R03]
MPVNITATQNLKSGKNKRWNNVPTIAIRVPEIFSEQLLEIARKLDSGETITPTVTLDLNLVSLEELLEVKRSLQEVIKKKQQELRDDSLEKAVVFLSSCCNGATLEDVKGFNKFDTAFGKWLHERIEQNEELSQEVAHSAYQMLQKYTNTQLTPGGYSLPKWKAIAHQDLDKVNPKWASNQEDEVEVPTHRLILEGRAIALYSPYDPDLLKLIKDKEYFVNFPEPFYVDKKFKSWNFLPSEAERLVQRCQNA